MLGRIFSNEGELGPFIGLLVFLGSVEEEVVDVCGGGPAVFFGAAVGLGIMLENNPNTDDISGPLDLSCFCSAGEFITLPAWWKTAEVTKVKSTVISGPTAVLPDHLW